MLPPPEASARLSVPSPVAPRVLAHRATSPHSYTWAGRLVPFAPVFHLPELETAEPEALPLLFLQKAILRPPLSSVMNQTLNTLSPRRLRKLSWSLRLSTLLDPKPLSTLALEMELSDRHSLSLWDPGQWKDAEPSPGVIHSQQGGLGLGSLSPLSLLDVSEMPPAGQGLTAWILCPQGICWLPLSI